MCNWLCQFLKYNGDENDPIMLKTVSACKARGWVGKCKVGSTTDNKPFLLANINY